MMDRILNVLTARQYKSPALKVRTYSTAIFIVKPTSNQYLGRERQNLLVFSYLE